MNSVDRTGQGKEQPAHDCEPHFIRDQARNRGEVTVSAIQATFVFVSVVGLLSAFATVLARNLVHAALFLIAFFFAVACLFVLLEAEFLAAMQILIYIGAVSILILFGIMLTRNIRGDETTDAPRLAKLSAGFIGLGLLGILLFAYVIESGRGGAGAWVRTEVRPGGVNPPLDGGLPARAASIEDMPRAIGVELMTRQIIAFELAGLMLTAALVGAIALARQDKSKGGRVSNEDEIETRGQRFETPAGAL